MRNPWGTDTTYKGAWNDNDANWKDLTNNYAAQVNFTNNPQDGFFFITSEDFFTYFNSFSISFYKDSYVSSTSTVLGDNNEGQKFEFTITTPTDGYIGVDFYNSKMYPKGCKNDSAGNY